MKQERARFVQPEIGKTNRTRSNHTGGRENYSSFL